MGRDDHIPTQPLFTFLRGDDRLMCDVRENGDQGVEAQFYENGVVITSQTFETTELAVRWALEEKEVLELPVRRPVPDLME
jgi:hypothetical protein